MNPNWHLNLDAKSWARIEAVALFVLILGFSTVLYASSGGGMPWDNVMERFQENMAGKLAKGVAIIMIVVVGFMVAKGMPMDGIAGKMIGVIMGVSLMAGAPAMAGYFGFEGCVLPY